MRVLVTGGAGYIGAHVVRELAGRGHEPLIFDDFRTSKPSRVGDFACVRAALEDVDTVLAAFSDFRPGAVIHMAGSISVGESVREPGKYWRNNLGAANSLLLAAARFPVQALVFSSTAAVYGDVDAVPIPESAPLRPTSPYGESKLAFERQLDSAASTLGLTAVALRYFNAAGAVPEWQVGEDHEPEEHLIPRVLRALAARQPITIYGDDWPTADGTCVRDYIHVHDLARAHVLAIEAHAELPSFAAFNVGTGHGASVRQVIAAAATATATEPEIVITPRRPGDPPQLVADPTAIQARLGWRPERSDLAQILGDAAAWEGVRG
jgi:UDP-glucose-4-epimerase GalE